jgi:hypothetical protein
VQSEFFIKFGFLRPMLILLVAACAVCFALPTAASADTATDFPEYGPTLGDGYVYWMTERHEKGDGAFSTHTVFQRRLSDGRTRSLFRLNRSIATGLYARGDKVAFALTQITREPFGKGAESITDFVYAMSAEDAAPTAITSSITVSSFKSGECGNTNLLHDISATGQVLVIESEKPCPRGKERWAANLYSLDRSPRVHMPGLQNASWAVLQYGRLGYTLNDFIVVRDLATGKSARYPHTKGADPYWNMLSPAGDVGAAAELDYSWRRGKIQTEIKIYPAGSTTPSARIKEWLDGRPVFVFCATGLVEMTSPGKGPMNIKLRSLDGTVLKSIDGPKTRGSAFGFDSVCTGNHLTLATSPRPGPPTIYNYDF